METNVQENKGTKVMVAIEENESSYHALMWVLENLQGSIFESHPLILFTVLPPAVNNGNIFAASLGSARMFCNVSSTPPEFLNSVHERDFMVSAGILEKAKSICANRGIKTETIAAVGNAKETICESVQKLKINLLVLGDHGDGKLKRTLLGSVSSYCVANAKCPVLVIKKPVS